MMNFIDIHSHILPNMDDGSRNVKQSLEMLRIAYGEGISAMIATPHNMPGKGCPPAEVVYESVAKMQQLADNYDIPIQILSGTEYYYREEVLDILEEERGITLASSDCVLIEFDPMAEQRYIRNALREVLGLGYTPVLAHVERYAKAMEDTAFLDGLKKMGVLFQVNAASVVGDNSRQVKKEVKLLLKSHMVEFVATDAHSDGHRAPYMKKCAEILYKKYGREYAEDLLFRNAEYYLWKGEG